MLAASRALDEAWLPPGIEAVRTEDYLVVRRPAHLTSAGSSLVQATITSSRPFREMRPEVERLARGWGAEEVEWRTDIEVAASESLRDAGALLVLTELVLARQLVGGDVDAWLAADDPPGVATELVTDRQSFDALISVETAGWDWPQPSTGQRIEEWASLQASFDAPSEFALLGSVDGQPASVARFALRGSIARLYGAVTLPELRGRGLYRSLLAARCRHARANGASLALTKGRVETSAPILQRAGFRRYAVEQCWRLRLEKG